MSEVLGNDELVLELAATDDWLHAGTVAQVLDHARSHRGEPRPGSPPSTASGAPRLVDLFDAGGHPLRAVLDDQFEVHGFIRSGPADEDAVRARVDRVLDLAQEFLDAHPSGGAEASWPDRAEVPRPDGSLEEVVTGLRWATTGDPRAHSAGWFHNLLHAMGG